MALRTVERGVFRWDLGPREYYVGRGRSPRGEDGDEGSSTGSLAFSLRLKSIEDLATFSVGVECHKGVDCISPFL